MLGLAAQEHRRAIRLAQPRPVRDRLRRIVRVLLTTIALAIGLNGLSMASAHALPFFDDLQDNMAATVVNMCGPNDVPNQATYTNIDTMAGLNQAEPHDGYRSTILPDFSKDEGGTQGGNGMDRLERVYGDQGEVIAKPTYERYGFSSLQWHQYGYDCFSPTLMMGPLANTGLMAMVNVPTMIAMAILNFVMSTALWEGFATLMQPFIGAMYEIFNPWIYFIVPLGVGITWLGSRGSLQATLKATGWGVMIMAVYMLMGSSTSPIVKHSTNFVTEVAGTAACKIDDAANGNFVPDLRPDPPPENATSIEVRGPKCDTDDPIKAVQQALWFGIPYQTWHLGQVGEHQAQLDDAAYQAGEVGWGPALLNGQYVGVDENGNVDKTGQNVIQHTDRWNRSNYSPDSETGKGHRWTTNNAWVDVPYLANIKIMCNDLGGLDDERSTEPSETTRWMYSGNDGTGNFCDAAGAGTSTMVPHIQGDAYNKQFLVALSGMIGAGAVALTIVVSSIYLGFQKMMFFFLLFMAPIVFLVSSIGDRKRRPFLIRYAEVVGSNLLKQIAAVCIVLFVSYAMASLFDSATFSAIPWVMKPYVALLFFVALAFLAFPLKSMIQGAIKGDTSVVDKQATAPQHAMKTGAKVAAVTGVVAATGGIAAAAGASGAGATALAGAGGKGAALGKAGSMLGQAGRVMGIGSKTGRAMRASGQLLKAGQGVMHARDSAIGRKIGTARAAATLLQENPERYRGKREDGTLGDLLPGAQERALQDAQSAAERGQRVQRAKSAHDTFMKDFAAGWRGPTPRDSMPTPSPKPAPGPDQRPLPPGGDTRQLVPGRGPDPSGSGDSPTPAPAPSGSHQDGRSGSAPGTPGNKAPAATGTQSPINPGSPASPSGDGEAQASTPAIAHERFAEKAKENLNGPVFAKEMEYSVSTVRSGDDVLSNAGLSKEQVMANPTLLLTSDAYEGGATTKMDPFHPSTAALNELRFVSSSGDEDSIQAAVAKAVDSISEHGVPSQVNGVNSIGDRAERFDPVQLVGAMPQLSENMTWQDRADAAYTMMAAQVALPADTPSEVRESVELLTTQLARPGVPLGDVAEHEADAIEAVSWWQNGRMADIEEAVEARGSLGAPAAEVEETLPHRERGIESTPAMVADPSGLAPVEQAGASPEDLRTAVADGLREHDASDVGSAPGQDEAPLSTEPVPPQGSESASDPSSGPNFTPPPAEYVDNDPVDAVEDSEALIWPGEDRKKRSGFFDDDEEEHDE